MENGRLNEESPSGRQLSVAVFTAGLSPAAALAGKVGWLWMPVWIGAAILLVRLVLRRIQSRAPFRGTRGVILYIMYAAWAAVLASRVLGRAVQRMELTSGGSSRLWLLLIFAVPLLWISGGKAAPFFRMAEILWLAMAVVLAALLVFGVVRVEWRYVINVRGNWWSSALAAGEIFVPALFVLPYINKVEERSVKRGLGWLAALGAAAAALSLVAAGILGNAAEQVPYAFFAAAGTLGKSARCEGLLSALWLLPDLTLAGLLCRVWGAHPRAAAGVLLAVGFALAGIGTRISSEICAAGTLALLLLTLFLPCGKGKIVVEF